MYGQIRYWDIRVELGTTHGWKTHAEERIAVLFQTVESTDAYKAAKALVRAGCKTQITLEPVGDNGRSSILDERRNPVTNESA